MGVMGTIWHDLGFMQGPLSLSALAILVLAVWSAMQVFGRDRAHNLRTKALIDAILFWGAFAVISGVLGTLVGLIEAAQSAELAGTASAGVMWGGIKQAILTSAAGMSILFAAALAWFVLQLRWRFLVADEAAGEAIGGRGIGSAVRQ